MLTLDSFELCKAEEHLAPLGSKWEEDLNLHEAEIM